MQLRENGCDVAKTRFFSNDLCCGIVVARSHARATAKASEPEFDVVSCASVMEAVQTMLSDHELLTECIKNCF